MYGLPNPFTHTISSDPWKTRLHRDVTCGWFISWMRTTEGPQVKWVPRCHTWLWRGSSPQHPITGNTLYTSLRSIVDSYNQPYNLKGFTFIWFFYLDSSPLEIREDCQLELWRAGSYLNGFEVLNKDLMLADSPTSEESWSKTCVRINICDSLSRPCLLMYGFCKMLMVCSLIDAHV